MSELKPFFSIAIPLYNKESHVKETIETVLDQTFQDFEIVVINDGSKDESVKIVETIKDDRIRIIHQENKGVSVVRNRDIKESRAEYIAFLDADDLWLPEFLETIDNLISDLPDTGLYATAYKKRKVNGEEININIQALPGKEYIGLIPNYFESIKRLNEKPIEITFSSGLEDISKFKKNYQIDIDLDRLLESCPFY